MEGVLKPSEARESEKRAIKIFEDRKSSEIFLVSSGSFRRWREIRRAHGTHGRIMYGGTIWNALTTETRRERV